MHKVVSTILIIFFISYKLYSQDQPKSRLNTESSINLGNQQFSTHRWLSYTHFFGKNRRLGVGYGIRWNSYFGSNQNFTSAPPALAGKRSKEATLSIVKARVNSLNFAIFLQYNFSGKLEAGFNVDAFGFSFGCGQNGRFISADANQQQSIRASPTSRNLLLIGANNYGSLYSEFFARYWFTSKLGIKLGVSNYFLEYTTNYPIVANEHNRRFRKKALLGLVGFSWRLR